MRKKSFKTWLKTRKIKLRPWQEKAAKDFLKTIAENQNAATGKTYLLKILTEFVNEHGNFFELP